MPKVLQCEQCGAPLSVRREEIGCVHCLLKIGMEPDRAEAARSPADFGTRSYQHYEILLRADGSPWELGRGAMGVTYKAIDVNLKMPVALKVLNGRFSALPDAHERFLHEAQAAAQLRHPNVASVFHFGVVNLLPESDSLGASAGSGEEIARGDCFYAMEFVEGETLEAHLRRRGPLSPSLAVDLGLQVARALVAAEKRELVHRDLKPSNIMVLAREEVAAAEGSNSDDAWVKVIDFGLAQAATGEEDAARVASLFLGTPEFASPEQREGRLLDIRSDIFSLGCTLWYALTGHVPFPPGEETQGELPLNQLIEREIPQPVISLLESMLAQDPADRCPSGAALCDVLRDCQRKLSSDEVGKRDGGFLGRPRKRLALAALSVVAILAGLAIYFFTSGTRDDDNSIAVLPFKNLSTDPNNAFFAEGIEDDIRSSLVKLHDLKVIGRSSVAYLKPEVPKDLRAIGKAIGVRHVLRGSLRRTGDRILLEVELLNTENGEVLWAERYDRSVSDAVNLQNELAIAIVDSLDATLSPRERADLGRKSTGNPDAYVLYLRGRKLEDTSAASISDFEAAADLYSEAITLDPGFAVAHARLASQLAILYRFRGPSEEVKRRAFAEARIALRLQPDLGEAHLANGQCFYHIERDFGRAMAEFQKARHLLPNDPEPESYIAYIRRRQGRWREARTALQHVASRDPRNLTYAEELFATACLLRDWPAALRYANRLVEIAPNLPQVQVERGYLDIWQHGNVARVGQFYADFKQYGDPQGDIFWGRWDTAMLERNFVRAQAAIDDFPFATLSSFLSAPVPKSYFSGCILLAQGYPDRAFKLFDAARPQMEAEVRAHPESAIRHSRLGLLYAYMDRKADAIREGERAAQLQPASVDAYDGMEQLCTLALIHARVGDNDVAIAMIESLLRKPGCVSFFEASLSLAELRLRWQWDPLRSDPRFQRILASPEPATVY